MLPKLKKKYKNRLSKNRPILDDKTQQKNSAEPHILDSEATGKGIENDTSKSLWDRAFESLRPNQQRDLRLLLSETNDDTKIHSGDPQIKRALRDVAETVQEQHNIRQAKNDGNRIHEAAKGILRAAWSLESTVTKVVVVDPTGYSTAVWGVVSLGLKFLTGMLARYAIVENIQSNHGMATTENIEDGLINLYVELLAYALEMREILRIGHAQRLWTSLSDIVDRPLSVIEAKIQANDTDLQKWLNLDHQILHHAKLDQWLMEANKIRSQLQDINQKFDISLLRVVDQAHFNSSDNETDVSLCLENTRARVLEIILDWILDAQSPKLFWLEGKAGTGKSTISRTLAKLLQEKGLLGASFFFKQGRGDRATAKYFVTTIIKQLSDVIPQLKSGIQEAIAQDSGVSERSIDQQFSQLFIEPLKCIQEDHMGRFIVFVIDAFDECQDKDGIQKILKNISRAIRALPKLQLRFFVVSRPEEPIISAFDRMDGVHEYNHCVLEERSDDEIKADMRTFLENWPETDVIEHLVERTAPLFILAATICRFVKEPKINPMIRLQEILEHANEASTLADTYLPILERSIQDEQPGATESLLQDFHRVVGSIACLYFPLSIQALARLLKIDEDTVERRVDCLRSVLTIPSDEFSGVTVYHQSFREFLIKGDSSMPFRINQANKHQELASRCFEVMKGLRNNMCNLSHDAEPRSEIPEAVIAQTIRPEMRYSCQYWIKHLQNSLDLVDKVQLMLFLENQFLYWLETMSILGLSYEVLTGLLSLAEIYPVSFYAFTNSAAFSIQSFQGFRPLLEFFKDSIRFVRKNIGIINNTPLQTYSSALIFTPKSSIVRKKYWKLVPDYFLNFPAVDEDWSPMVQEIDVDNARIMAFCPDGRWLASGRRELGLWDISDSGSGKRAKTLKTLQDSVIQCLRFSPDSHHLAIGYQDSRIEIWNIENDDQAKVILEREYSKMNVMDEDTENNPMGCVFLAFSQNAKFLLSESQESRLNLLERAIKIWDLSQVDACQSIIPSRLPVYESETKSETIFLAMLPSDMVVIAADSCGSVRKWIKSADGDWSLSLSIPYPRPAFANDLAISPDCKHLASAEMSEVDIWDIENLVDDTPIRVLNTFSAMIKIAFSSDSRWLAGQTVHGLIQVWDLATGFDTPSFVFEKKCSTGIMGFEFFNDGKSLASWYRPSTVQIWNLSEPFASMAVSNTRWGIRELRISKDGKRLASSSLDSGLEIWQVEVPGIITNEFQYKHTHTSHRFQRAMDFSQNGEWLAFYSEPKVLIRDIFGKTQALSLGPAGQCSAFSADGQLLAVVDSCESKFAIWDITKSPPLKIRELDIEEHSYVQTLVFAPDNKRLAVSSIMGHITVCDLDDETEPTPRWIGDNYGVVHSMRFSADTTHIITEHGAFDSREDQPQEPKNSEDWQLALGIQDEWVIIGGHKCLWLPAEFRGCWTAYEGFLYIGTKSGIHCLGLRIDRDLLAKYNVKCTSTS
ncbi:hypothetical protein N7456_004329 [Penicillium angulare]|uniref:NACHT domain-containing protein n=1 Tax=Penicillium angulare TaxID=116970 RepID=A0A9W9KIA3_9EURO|nr:hypothetical protein N7456_004329 [Penicillium angulare]